MGKVSRGKPRLPVYQLAILDSQNPSLPPASSPISYVHPEFESSHGYFSIFPDIEKPEMIESFGVERKEVAKWAGMLPIIHPPHLPLTILGITSAVFSLSQCCTAIAWGQASDALGRKRTILMGLTSTMIFSIVWGLSTSLPWAITARAFSGAGNGNVGIIRTMVAEMVPEKVLQPRAFSVMPLVWAIGSVLGPAFGGFFASPAVNLPGLFKNSKLFTAFPFLLPNLIAAVFFAVGILVGFLFMKETLETQQHVPDYGLALGQKIKQCFKPSKDRKHNPDYDDDELRAALLHHTHSPSNSFDSTRPLDPSPHKHPHAVHAPPSVWEVFNTQSTLSLLSYTFLALHSMAFDQLLPIFMHHPRRTSAAFSLFKFTGGFGISSSRIGTLFTLYGIIAGIVQFFVFPPVVNRFGVLASYRVCAVVIPAVMFVTPYTALIQDETTQQATMFAIMAVKACTGIFMFPCAVISLTNSAGSMRLLGTLNGVATTTSAVGRAAGPFLAGTAFTWGLERGYVIVAWWMLGVFAIIGAIPIFYLVETDGVNKASENDEGDSSDEDEIVYVEDDAGTIMDGDEFLAESDAEEAIHTVDGPPLDREHRLGVAIVRRRMSSSDQGPQ